MSRSEEAKALGIPMGAPIRDWVEFYRRNDVEVWSSNYPLYGDMSARVMQTLKVLSGQMEIYSIDEAFLRVPKGSRNDLEDFGRKVRAIVKKWTGIFVSVGIAQTKTLAKTANKIAKKCTEAEGVCVFAHAEDASSFLDEIDVREVWGIGPQRAAFLKKHDITTALALRNSRDEWVKKYLSVCGLRTVLELRGIPSIPLVETLPAKKGIACSRSFGKLVGDLRELEEALAVYVARAAEKLRKQHDVAGLIHVYLLTDEFRLDLPQYCNALTFRLNTPTAYTPDLVRVAHRSLERIYRSGYLYRKMGVYLAEIVPANQIQLDIFEPPPPFEKHKNLMASMDTLNRRWGRDTVALAAAGIEKPWRMRQSRLSKRCTTNWDELVTARL